MLTERSVNPPDDATPIEHALLVKARAMELGFSAVGIASAAGPIEPEFSRYRAALADGLHGPIDYLADNVEARRQLDADSILAGARSVIVVAARYDRPDDEPTAELVRGIARYARGRDYHNHLRKKLRNLARFVRALAPSVEARPLSDTAPVLEKAWAARAGVGFLGKNGVVITPGEGSYTLLGEVVTTLALAPDTPMEERCGRCTLCIEACPTDALIRPFVLDAGKCVSTTTIELRGPVPEPLRVATSEHLFGCDICQEVCPYNAKRRPLPPLADRYVPHERWGTLTLEVLARIGMSDGPDFASIVESSPLRRSGPEGLARNACLALGREARPENAPLLRDIAERHPSAVVRDAARWALDRIVSSGIE
jgi:epoxyqueuosine reductase